MSSLPPEIFNKLFLPAGTSLTVNGSLIETVGQLRDALLPLGLEITTDDAVTWDVKYPRQAEHITRICELERELNDLQHSLDQRGFEALPVPIEKKEAAE